MQSFRHESNKRMIACQGLTVPLQILCLQSQCNLFEGSLCCCNLACAYRSICFGHFLYLQLSSLSIRIATLLWGIESSFEFLICEMCITRACEDPTSPGVWWRDDAEWKKYDDAMAAAILQGLTERANRVELGPMVSSKHPYGAEYVTDLSTMEQINVATGFTRDVKVVNAPAAVVPAPPVNAWDDLVSVKEELRECQESIKTLTETVMKLVAAKIAAASKKQSKLKFKVQSSKFRQTIGKPMVGAGTYLAPIRLHEDDY